jgi:predicted nuclease of predicted toxin-antitoxin system
VNRDSKEIVVLLDEGTPIAVAEPFVSRGHYVIYHREVMDSGAKDDVVAATAILNNAILVAVDADMKRLVRRFGSPNNSERYKRLHLIFLSCDQVLAAKRLDHAMSFVEGEWAVTCEKAARRLWLDIGPHRLTSYR